MRYIHAFNKWYDSLEEPGRFLLFLCMIVPLSLAFHTFPMVGYPLALGLIAVRVLK